MVILTIIRDYKNCLLPAKTLKMRVAQPNVQKQDVQAAEKCWKFRGVFVAFFSVILC
jgi:hypothetical protein